MSVNAPLVQEHYHPGRCQYAGLARACRKTGIATPITRNTRTIGVEKCTLG
jgi:hypothetical protein